MPNQQTDQPRPIRTIIMNIARASRKSVIPDPLLLAELQQELREAKLLEVIERDLMTTPPLSAERRARLAAVLRDAPTNGGDTP